MDIFSLVYLYIHLSNTFIHLLDRFLYPIFIYLFSQPNDYSMYKYIYRALACVNYNFAATMRRSTYLFAYIMFQCRKRRKKWKEKSRDYYICFTPLAADIAEWPQLSTRNLQHHHCQKVFYRNNQLLQVYRQKKYKKKEVIRQLVTLRGKNQENFATKWKTQRKKWLSWFFGSGRLS